MIATQLPLVYNSTTNRAYTHEGTESITHSQHRAVQQTVDWAHLVVGAMHVAIRLGGRKACSRCQRPTPTFHHSSTMPGSGVPPSSESSASFLQTGGQAGEQGVCVLLASVGHPLGGTHTHRGRLLLPPYA
jgi:hypothetical protein